MFATSRILTFYRLKPTLQFVSDSPLQLFLKILTIISVHIPYIVFVGPKISCPILYYVILLLFPRMNENGNTEVVQFFNRVI